MSSSSARDDESLITGINVTPLVDVVLVLLVILMVTATYIAAQTIPVDLPKATTGEATATTLAVSIGRDGRIWLDGQQLDRGELRKRLRRSRGRRETRAVIAADGSAAHRSVVSVIDVLREEGVTRFAINVQPDALGTDG
jgi:biopolymer transport protein ExbD